MAGGRVGRGGGPAAGGGGTAAGRGGRPLGLGRGHGGPGGAGARGGGSGAAAGGPADRGPRPRGDAARAAGAARRDHPRAGGAGLRGAGRGGVLELHRGAGRGGRGQGPGAGAGPWRTDGGGAASGRTAMWRLTGRSVIGAGWGHGTAHLHRAPAGGRLRHAARGRQGDRRPRIRRLLPLGPLSDDGRRRAAGTHGRVGHAGRSRAGDQQDQARHPDVGGHLPAAGRAGDPGGPGRRHVGWAGRVRARCRLVRGRAHRLRHPLPEGEDRQARRAVGGHHRAVGDPGRQDLRLRRGVLPAQGLARAAQAGAGEGPGADRRHGRQAHPGTGSALRRRVQRALRLDRGLRRADRAGPRGGAGGGPGVRQHGLLERAGGLCRQGRRRSGPAGGGDRPRGRGAEGERAGRIAGGGRGEDRALCRAGRDPLLPADPRPGRPGPPGADRRPGRTAAGLRAPDAFDVRRPVPARGGVGGAGGGGRHPGAGRRAVQPARRPGLRPARPAVDGPAARRRARADRGRPPGLCAGGCGCADHLGLPGQLRGLRPPRHRAGRGGRAAAAQRGPGPPGGGGAAGGAGGGVGGAVRCGAGRRQRIPRAVRPDGAGAGALPPAADRRGGCRLARRPGPGDGAGRRRGRGDAAGGGAHGAAGVAVLHRRRRAHPGRAAAGRGLRTGRGPRRGGGGGRQLLCAAGRPGGGRAGGGGLRQAGGGLPEQR
ncbi:conserved hypothetical protein [Actinacidiphila bryophytorum]|uniref:Uncharacterized protein n=1 Tax=Actinacidiphila bryophytorum TaxID=1436133 RepID=A0A9W4H6H7_9ACTN|nr:conserved hypothetical protein [Actinacidiphila bryophytorum]